MHGISFLQDLAVVMIVAGLVTLVCHQLRQPVVLGYLLAGVIIGPHTPPFPLIRDATTIRTLAELGMVVMMFALGLDFSVRKLRGVGLTVLLAGTLEILLMFWIGYETGRFLGWSPIERIFLGAMLSISSTMIALRNLRESPGAGERFRQVVFGILVVEDLLAVGMIALLSGIALSGEAQTGALLGTLTRLSVFFSVALVLGLLAVPRLMAYVARFRSDEMMLVTALGLCFGTALLSARLGYSAALGAFVIGAVIAESRQGPQVAALAEPIRDMFSAVFFVAMGLMIDPELLVAHAVPIAILTGAVIAGKILACAAGTFVAGEDLPTALRVGLSLGQIGEFSFVIAALGAGTGAAGDSLYPVAAGVAAVTAFVSPHLVRRADRIILAIGRNAPKRLLAHMAIYHRKVAELAKGNRSNAILAHLRRTALQLTLNLALLMAAFGAAAWLARYRGHWLPPVPEWAGGSRALLWLVTMVLASPLYVATLRKLNALSLFFAEMAVPLSIGGEGTVAVRFLIARTLFAAAVFGLILVTTILSSAILPPWKVVWVLALAVAGVAVLFWNSFVKLYARAQISLKETLEAEPDPVRAHAPAAAGPHLSEADLAMAEVRPGTEADGRLIRELELRRQTGVTVVAVEREGRRTLNPGPDEEIRAGDRLLLLGSPAQLKEAGTLLGRPAPAGGAAE